MRITEKTIEARLRVYVKTLFELGVLEVILEHDPNDGELYISYKLLAERNYRHGKRRIKSPKYWRFVGDYLQTIAEEICGYCPKEDEIQLTSREVKISPEIVRVFQENKELIESLLEK